MAKRGNKIRGGGNSRPPVYRGGDDCAAEGMVLTVNGHCNVLHAHSNQMRITPLTASQLTALVDDLPRSSATAASPSTEAPAGTAGAPSSSVGANGQHRKQAPVDGACRDLQEYFDARLQLLEQTMSECNRELVEAQTSQILKALSVHSGRSHRTSGDLGALERNGTFYHGMGDRKNSKKIGGMQDSSGRPSRERPNELTQVQPAQKRGRDTPATPSSNAGKGGAGVLEWGQNKVGQHPKSSTFASVLSYIPAVGRLIMWMSSGEEPKRTGPIASLVSSMSFNMLCQLVIFMNATYVFFYTNYTMDNLSDDAPLFNTLFEITFAAFYTVELCLKLWVHSKFFFFGEEAGWNLFDSTLVAITILDVMGTVAGSVGFARTLRVLKAVKVLRVVRVLQFASELRLMMNCVLGSLVSLFWCIVMICFVMFLFAVYFTQAVGQHLRDTEPNLTNVGGYPIFEKNFGSVQTTMLTLFKAVTGGADWQEIYWVLQPVGNLKCAIFLLYVFVFLFSIWNVIMSVFVEKALKLAQPDVDDVMLEKRIKDFQDGKELTKLFEKADMDKSTTLNQEEFELFCSQPEFQRFLQARGIDIKEANLFFEMLVDSMGESEVPVGDLVATCIRIKGFATSIDLHTLRYEVRSIARLLLGEAAAASICEFGESLSKRTVSRDRL